MKRMLLAALLLMFAVPSFALEDLECAYTGCFINCRESRCYPLYRSCQSDVAGLCSWGEPTNNEFAACYLLYMEVICDPQYDNCLTECETVCCWNQQIP